VSTRLLETTLNPFPLGTGDYVSHDVLKDYIQDTALKTGVDKVIHYNTEVTEVWKCGNSWIVDTVTLHTNFFGAIMRTSTTSVSFASA
jgi:ACS family pantothenate transporter-like MFS transporter